jgi:nicotinamide-nucleotide amidase
MPNAEVLSVGTELLLGQVLDTNSQFVAVELAKLGIDCYFRSTVGDNKQRVKDAIRIALNRADVLITTGGLGPTADDLTTECLAEFFQSELVFDEEVFAYISALFRERNYPMPESNRKQALRPSGADKLPNPAGTAPGLIWRLGKETLAQAGIEEPERERIILTFPGVPRELKAMWRETAAPFLQSQYSPGVLWSIELKHYGIGESALAEQYGHLLEQANPTVAPYAGHGECRLRVTAKANDVAAARKIAEPVIEEIRTGSRHRCYGVDDDTLESVIGKLLTERELKLSVAESCTGGLVSQRLTDIPGSSKYIGLNVVTYSNQAKSQFLGVKDTTLASHGAVSAECAEEMAKGVLRLGQADIGLSVTGVAGPDGGTEEKPVGLVYLGLACKDFYAGQTLRLGVKSSRSEIRFRTANEALNMVRLFLLDRISV